MRDHFVVATFERFEISKKNNKLIRDIGCACAKFKIFSLTIQPVID